MAATSHPGLGLAEDLALPDRYRVVGRIARGGMASVWCAEDNVLGRRVAIKLLAEQFVDDQRAVRRFEREARTAARLSEHPNVVTIYDVGQTAPHDDGAPGRPFIVIEHLAGGSVADAIRVGNVPREQALRWLDEAAAAIDHAHRCGVIHRDIKPGNLLLDLQQTLHVADFGIARLGAEEAITTTGQLLGTAAYVSPEQALGRPATDASDRYALAVVAFELLVGERPFIAGSFASQARQHVESQPPAASARNARLSPALDPVLASGMAKAPQERFPTAVGFADAVRAALIADPASHAARIAPPARRSQPAPAPRTRRPRAFALAGLATAAFGLGIALGASNDGNPANRAAMARATGAAAVKHRQKPARNALHHRAAPKHRHHAPLPPPTTTATPAAATTTAPTETAATSAPPTAETLEAQGHQLMVDGNYSQAIGVLRQALGAAPPGSLIHAYAQYDLGRSLRLAGDPRAAVPVLQQRLRVPNQRGIVRHELTLAQRAAGARAAPSGGAPTSPPAKHDHKHARKPLDHGRHGHDRGD